MFHSKNILKFSNICESICRSARENYNFQQKYLHSRVYPLFLPTARESKFPASRPLHDNI